MPVAVARRAPAVLALLAAWVLLVAGAPPAAQGADPPLDRPALQRELDAIAAQAPGALVLVRDRGRTLFASTSGTADLATGEPLALEDRFRAGSTTKTVVAAAVLGLEAEGRLSLDDPVERWLPGLVPGGAQITLRHLLSHRSGLPDHVLPILVEAGSLEALRLRRLSPTALVRAALTQPPLFAPGAGFGYSNTNYVLLGLVVRRATGRTLPAELRRRVFRPLGLDDTSLPVTDTTLPPPYARGYLREAEDAPRVDWSRQSPTWVWAAGNLVTDADDLARFYDALLGGRLLPARALARMRAAEPIAPDVPVGYGLGLFAVGLPCGGTVEGHGGDVFGYSTYAFRSPAGRTVVVMRTEYDAAPISLANRVAAVAFCGDQAPVARAAQAAWPRLRLFDALGR